MEIISKGYLSLFTIFGGFAPNSETAQVLSKSLGSRTVMSGSISRGKNDPSQSLQMMERPLLTADELKSLPKGNFVIMKTGVHPMKTVLRLFLDWGISFGNPYIMEEKSHRRVFYADKETLEENIINQGVDFEEDIEEIELGDEKSKSGGMSYNLSSKINSINKNRRPTLRT